MPVASSGNCFYQALTSSLSMNSSIQQNYVTDASLANDCTKIQNSINDTTIKELQKDQDAITSLVNNFDKDDNNYNAKVTAAQNKYSQDSKTFQIYGQEATSNQNIINDSAQRESQNAQNFMNMISPILQAFSGLAQTLAA